MRALSSSLQAGLATRPHHLPGFAERLASPAASVSPALPGGSSARPAAPPTMLRRGASRAPATGARWPLPPARARPHRRPPSPPPPPPPSRTCSSCRSSSRCSNRCGTHSSSDGNRRCRRRRMPAMRTSAATRPASSKRTPSTAGALKEMASGGSTARSWPQPAAGCGSAAYGRRWLQQPRSQPTGAGAGGRRQQQRQCAGLAGGGGCGAARRGRHQRRSAC